MNTNTVYRLYVEKLGGTSPSQFVGDEGEVFYDPNVKALKISDGITLGGNVIVPQEFSFVSTKSDFPEPVNGVITLEDNYTYLVTDTVDLLGDRLVAGDNTTILGGSSENCRIKSTGISTTTPLLSSAYSLPIRNITFEAPYAIYLQASIPSVHALDWFGVNFTNCAKVGIISSYNNFIMLDSAFLSSQDLTFDGTTGTIGFNQCLFSGDFAIGGTRPILKVADTANITRRFRASINSFVVPSGMTAISIGTTSIPNEALILDTCNFSGSGSYLEGDATDLTGIKPLFTNNRGISNTFATGQIYMQNNATQTSIGATDTWTKVAGITTDTGEIAKFTASVDNRLTCIAAIEREYAITASISFRCEANNNVKFGFYDSRLGDVREASQIKHTSSVGELHQVTVVDLVTQFNNTNYIEVHCKNLDSMTPITVEFMNLIIHEVG